MTVSRKIDILLVQYTNIDHYPPTINGLKIMADAGFNVVVLCRDDWPETNIHYPGNTRVIRIGRASQGGVKAPIFFLQFLFYGFKLALFLKPKIIYGCDLHGFVTAGIIGEVLNIPYIYHLYDTFLAEEGIGAFDSKLKPLEKQFAQKADCLIFPSKSKATHFLKTAGVVSNYFVVANAPLKQSHIRRSKSLEKAILLQGGSPLQIVLYQGSIGPGKGFETLIHSMPKWPEGSALALLGIVRPPEYMDFLLKIARERGVERRVFYLGLVNYDKLLDMTSSAALGVFLPTSKTNMHTTSGTAVNKIMEYMACGVPAVVSQYPALKELMQNTGAGVATDPNDPEAIGLAIRELLINKNKWEAYALNGRKAHLEKYHYENQYEPIIKRLTSYV